MISKPDYYNQYSIVIIFVIFVIFVFDFIYITIDFDVNPNKNDLKLFFLKKFEILTHKGCLCNDSLC